MEVFVVWKVGKDDVNGGTVVEIVGNEGDTEVRTDTVELVAPDIGTVF